MNTQEQKRVMVLNQILAGQLSAAEAAALLHLSQRQVQRILAAYRRDGVAAVVHGNRGRKPIHTMSAQARQQVIALAQTTYQVCEVVAFPSLLFRRHYTVYCPLNAIDLVERRYTNR